MVPERDPSNPDKIVYQAASPGTANNIDVIVLLFIYYWWAFPLNKWSLYFRRSLKGLGHAILGNFSTDRMVIELTKISKYLTVQNYRRTLAKHREAKKGHGWTKLERIEMDWIWLNLKNVGPPFFKFISVCIKMSFTAEKSFSVVMWPWFCKWKTLALPIWRWEFIINKIKQNDLK